LLSFFILSRWADWAVAAVDKHKRFDFVIDQTNSQKYFRTKNT
jgi:hypothetical protein